MTATSPHRMQARADGLEVEPAPPPEVLIAPVKRRISVRDVTANGGLVRVLVARDLKVKYKQSVLGPIWLVFQPFALLVAFIIGFHSVAGVETEGVPYALFALTGLSRLELLLVRKRRWLDLADREHEPRAVHVVSAAALTVANLLASLPAFIVPACAAIVAAWRAGTFPLGCSSPRPSRYGSSS